MEKGTTAAPDEARAHALTGPYAPFLFALSPLTLLLALWAPPAPAGELHLLINGKAVHLDKQPNVSYNESNWGTGVQYDWDKREDGWIPFITASGFDDSNRNPSYYAGGGMLRRYYFHAGDVRLHADVGVIAFVMTRKDFKEGDPFPGVLPAFSLGTRKVAVNMTFIPKVDPKMVPILFFQLKVKLGEL